MSGVSTVFILSIRATSHPQGILASERIGINEIARQCREAPSWQRMYEGTEAHLWDDAFTTMLRAYEFSSEANANQAVLMYFDVYRHVDREQEGGTSWILRLLLKFIHLTNLI